MKTDVSNRTLFKCEYQLSYENVGGDVIVTDPDGDTPKVVLLGFQSGPEILETTQLAVEFMDKNKGTEVMAVARHHHGAVAHVKIPFIANEAKLKKSFISLFGSSCDVSMTRNAV